MLLTHAILSSNSSWACARLWYRLVSSLPSLQTIRAGCGPVALSVAYANTLTRAPSSGPAAAISIMFSGDQAIANFKYALRVEYQSANLLKFFATPSRFAYPGGCTTWFVT